jgi:DNA-binding response OmpR family regulator
MRILIVEDDERLARVMERVLLQERFTVDLAADGETGLESALTGIYDALIVDWMLPRRDGVQLIRELRAEHVATPVLMLTARGEIPQRVEGLNAGADDYLGNPFAFDELIARLRALARRRDKPLSEPTEMIGAVRIDFASHTVSREGLPIELSPREFAVLEVLVRHRGQVLSRDQILERVWGYDADPHGNPVDLYVHYLRRKLDPNRVDAEPVIRTVRGAGYVVPAA